MRHPPRGASAAAQDGHHRWRVSGGPLPEQEAPNTAEEEQQSQHRPRGACAAARDGRACRHVSGGALPEQEAQGKTQQERSSNCGARRATREQPRGTGAHAGGWTSDDNGGPTVGPDTQGDANGGPTDAVMLEQRTSET